MTCSLDRSQYTEPLLRYHEARDQGLDATELEAVALEANFGIAGAFARAVKGAADLEDVESAARLGLLEALRSWSPDGGASLPTWARGPMAAAVREVKEQTVQAVRVPAKTLRAAREIEASGEDVDEACARRGKRPVAIKAALGVRSCELTAEAGATTFEDRIFDAEVEHALAGASACWRGDVEAARMLTASESLEQRRRELLKAAGQTGDSRIAAEHRALADVLWPTSAEGRLRVLARLDYALTVAATERETDVECWRRHYVEGQRWTEIGAWLDGVTRTRAQFRARRAEQAIARALVEAGKLPGEALELWARRPAPVVELERLGVLDGHADPLAILYAVEDLEVALTEIDPRHASAWSGRAKGLGWATVARCLGVGRKAARAWASRASAALRELLKSAAEAVQLELLGATASEWVAESWWMPVAKEVERRVTGAIKTLRSRSARRRPLLRPMDALRLLASTVDQVTGPGAPTTSGAVGCTGPPEFYLVAARTA